jgi:hypothetical protein
MAMDNLLADIVLEAHATRKPTGLMLKFLVSLTLSLSLKLETKQYTIHNTKGKTQIEH